MIKKVNHSPFKQIFSCILAFFGFSFFYCTDVKAQDQFNFQDGNQYSSRDRFNSIQSGIADHIGDNRNFNKWIPWVFTTPVTVQLFSVTFFRFYLLNGVFRVACAKEFYIHTGLSPPAHLS